MAFPKNRGGLACFADPIRFQIWLLSRYSSFLLLSKIVEVESPAHVIKPTDFRSTDSFYVPVVVNIGAAYSDSRISLINLIVNLHVQSMETRNSSIGKRALPGIA